MKKLVLMLLVVMSFVATGCGNDAFNQGFKEGVGLSVPGYMTDEELVDLLVDYETDLYLLENGWYDYENL